MSDGTKKPVAHDVAAWQGHADCFARSQGQVGVFYSNLYGGSHFVVGFIDNDLAVDFIGRGTEQSFRQNLVEERRLHAVLSDQRHAFADDLDRTAENEVVGNFHRCGCLRFSAGYKGLLPENIEQGL